MFTAMQKNILKYDTAMNVFTPIVNSNLIQHALFLPNHKYAFALGSVLRTGDFLQIIVYADKTVRMYR